MTNQKYWENFYKKPQLKEPTAFAKFCFQYLYYSFSILDVGCGNGRDSYWFGKQGYSVMGIDFAIKPADNFNTAFQKIDLAEFIKEEDTFDVKYCRFATHAIDEKLFADFLRWIKGGMLMIEARSIKDNSFKPDHKRNLADGNKLLGQLIELGFEIKYFKEGKGMAVLGGQDPVIIRIIAEKI